MIELKGLTKLESLNLKGREIDDKWLDQLKELENLNWLGLGRTGVTDAGVIKLQQSKPELNIQRY